MATDTTQKTLDNLTNRIGALETLLGELKNELLKAIGDLENSHDDRIVKLGERVVALEEAPTPAPMNGGDIHIIYETLNELHLRVMGVPAGELQSLSDKPAQG